MVFRLWRGLSIARSECGIDSFRAHQGQVASRGPALTLRVPLLSRNLIGRLLNAPLGFRRDAVANWEQHRCAH